MDPEQTKLLIGLLQPIINAIALIIGGIWVYRKYIIQREKEPGTDIDIDVNFVGIQDNQWIIEITSYLENKSLVRHSYKDFQVTVRYLLPKDKVQDGDAKIFYQLNFPRTIDDRINGAKRLFENVDYINPKQQFKHRYITSIPVESTFVWIQCKFFFEIGLRRQKMNSQRIFRVPRKEYKLGELQSLKEQKKQIRGRDKSRI